MDDIVLEVERLEWPLAVAGLSGAVVAAGIAP
jgi:hypothetical protein